MPKKKTHDEFVQEVYELFGNEYNVLGLYVNGKTKVLLKHNECNNTFEIMPNNFLTRRKCPHCSRIEGNNKKMKTTDEFKIDVFNLVKNEYEVLGEYKGFGVKILIKHNKCGHEFSPTPVSFLSGSRCPCCARKNSALEQTKTHSQFIQEVFELFGDEYTVLGEYVHCNEKITIRHNICGNIYDAKPSSITKGSGCLQCFRNSKRKSTEQFKQEVYNLTGNEYEVIGEYKNNRTNIEIKHNDCDNVFNISPSNFLRGNRCPSCSKSKGEKMISDWLEINGKSYSPQYKFDDCKNILPLPFDFAIFNSENELILLIEYDGEQHFRPVNFGGISDEEALKNFKITQQRDKIKNTYCKNNDIPLLRIPYWDFNNIEEILESNLINTYQINYAEVLDSAD